MSALPEQTGPVTPLAVASTQGSPEAPRPSRRGDRLAMLRGSWRLLASLALMGTGIALVLLGWWGAAHTNILSEQIPYLISGGLLGLGLIIVAGMFAALAPLERETQRLREDIAALARAGRTGLVAGAPAAGPRVYTVTGGRSYHFAGCPILEGKETAEHAPADAVEAGYASCKLCGAD